MTSNREMRTLEDYGLEKDDLVRAKVLIYKRVSRDEQEDNTSLESQDEQGREVAAFLGLPVHNVYQDVFTGTLYRERKGLAALREDYRRLSAERYKTIVIVYRFDRFSRDQVHFSVLIDELQHYHAKLVSVKEKNLDDSPIGRATRALQAFTSEMEQEKIIGRTHDGRLARVQREGRMLPGCKAAYGYRWDDPRPKAKNKLVVYEPEAEIVRMIFKKYAEGDSIKVIVRYLEEKNVPPPLKNWATSSIHMMLKNKQYIGVATAFKHNRTLKDKVAHSGGRSVPESEQITLPDGTIPALVSVELFNIAQARLLTNKQDSARRGGHEAMLRSGFAVCGYCGGSMIAIRQPAAYVRLDGRKDKYPVTYRCGNSACIQAQILVEKLDTEVWASLERLAGEESVIGESIKQRLGTNLFASEVKALEIAIGKQEELIAQYAEDLEDTALKGGARKIILGMLSQAQESKEGIEKELAELQTGRNENERIKKSYQEIIVWCEQVQKDKGGLTMLQKRDFMRVLGVIVSVYKEADTKHERYEIDVKLPGIASSISLDADPLPQTL